MVPLCQQAIQKDAIVQYFQAAFPSSGCLLKQKQIHLTQENIFQSFSCVIIVKTLAYLKKKKRTQLISKFSVFPLLSQHSNLLKWQASSKVYFIPRKKTTITWTLGYSAQNLAVRMDLGSQPSKHTSRSPHHWLASSVHHTKDDGVLEERVKFAKNREVGELKSDYSAAAPSSWPGAAPSQMTAELLRVPPDRTGERAAPLQGGSWKVQAQSQRPPGPWLPTPLHLSGAGRLQCLVFAYAWKSFFIRLPLGSLAPDPPRANSHFSQ